MAVSPSSVVPGVRTKPTDGGREALVVRRALVGAAVTVVVGIVALPGVSGAATHTRIGPHQHFAALVNGSAGTPAPAVIRMACPGPTFVGQTGHPLAGQTVEVRLDPAVAGGPGYTGNSARSIGVFFGPPPPSTTAPGQVSFTRYGIPKAIPTTLTFPCGGTGFVTFVPFPQSPPTSRSASVAVAYANVAVAATR